MLKFRSALIRSRRLEEGLSQVQVAKALHMSPTTYGAMERGQSTVPVDVAANLAEVLGCAIEDFFEAEGEPAVVALMTRRERTQLLDACLDAVGAGVTGRTELAREVGVLWHVIERAIHRAKADARKAQRVLDSTRAASANYCGEAV